VLSSTLILPVLCVLELVSSLAQPASNAPAACQQPFVFPGRDWKQMQAGWSQEGLARARQFADSLHDSSVIIVQCGRVIDAWGDTTQKLTTFSVRKSLISALYGIYAAEGKIDIDQTLEQAGIDDSPSPLTPGERRARIVDLLRARSGVYHAASFETDFQRKTRPTRGSHPRGAFWFYNNWDFNVLGAIFEKKTGLKIGEAFYRRIAKQIGMQDFQPQDVYYVSDTQVSQYPAYMFRMTARDMARFGLLYLSNGRWRDLQIIPADWVWRSSHATEMVSVGNVKLGGYEYLWWVEYGGVHMGEATLPGMFSAQGAGGHYILIIPTLNMVVINQFNNEPQAHDPKSVLSAAQNHKAMFDDDFYHLMKRILDARLYN
jgi:CubicO group peptidase (beta-lactamase class C family)